MPRKAFLEITNACNLSCSFCHKTSRKTAYMSREEFLQAANGVRPFADYLYFHLMGEPLLHPLIEAFLGDAGELGFKVILTTNGTLLKKRQDALFRSSSLHKVSISLHAYEANAMGVPLEDYLSECFDFCKKASEKGIICVMRLWNIGGEEKRNEEILSMMHDAFPGEWKEIYSGYKMAEKVFLEWGERFEWPDANEEREYAGHTCYGLSDQIGVLCDGTVVPCCLDADGAVSLGNIFKEPLSDILEGERAKRMRKSLEKHAPCEKLCKSCQYAASRYSKK